MQRSNNTHYTVIDENYRLTKSRAGDASDDELVASNGQVHAHWQAFIAALETLGLEEMEARHQQLRRLLRENGVTYVVHGEEQGHRPWELDPIPLIFSSTEWERISAGLTQRAELLNLVLTDVYGERRLIKEGVLPPEIVYAHAGFLRECDGIASGLAAGTTPGKALLLYAADLARGLDGQLWVLSDRAQAPSGAGYALENRTALARVMPNLFGDIGVHRLSFFFRAMQNELAEISPHGKANPHVVMLTPGPLNETYFEHAYLASYLGYTLVQGDDLTVWDGRVWLKSLDGLQPVDIIFRRVDDVFCDALELRQDSRLGVAGLMEAIRLGNVAVVNAPGTSVLENPGLMPFLPNIAKWFGITPDCSLLLPSVATWWCGQRAERAYVLENLEHLVIKTIHRKPMNPYPLFGAALSVAELATLRAQIHAEPHLYVGQEQVHFSTTPSLIDGKLEPRHATLRSFLFSQREGYVVMPGGLTRSAAKKGALIVSSRAGGVSKDTWILADEPQQHVSLWRQPKNGLRPLAYDNVGNSRGLSSRAAENLFWVGRYAERAEGQARLLRIILETLQSSPLAEDARDLAELTYLRSLFRSITGFYGTAASTEKRNAALSDELFSLTLDTQNSSSLVSTLQSMVTAAYAVRDRWSTDTWRVMNNIENLCTALEKNLTKGRMEELESGEETSRQEGEASRPGEGGIEPGRGGIENGRFFLPGGLQGTALDAHTLQEIQTELDRLMIFLAALTGLNAESMTQTIGWLSLDMGRRIERALLLIRLCRSSLVGAYDDWLENRLLESMLAAAESLITYRGRYRAELHFPTVLELLLLDESNPRALVYQLKRLQEQIRSLPREKLGYRLSKEEQLILEALTQLQLSNTVQLAERSGQMRQGLEKLLARLAQLLHELSEALTLNYFSHVQGPQQFVAVNS